MSSKLPQIKLSEVKILYPNFSGKPTKFRKSSGIRDFVAIVPDDVAIELEQMGLNIKYVTKPDDSEFIPYYTLSIAVSYNAEYDIRPRVFMVTDRKLSLDEDTIDILDDVEIVSADIVINQSAWSVNGNKGVKAYLDKIYVVVVEDEFDKKYRDVPSVKTSSVEDEGFDE